jgi:putative ABC transport system substrate-binding protein
MNSRILLATATFVVFTLFSHWLFKPFGIFTRSTVPEKRIAIIATTMLGEFHRTVVGAFEKKLKESGKNYRTKIFTPNGVNRILLAAMTEEAVESSFDLIFTIGASASQVAQSVLRKRENPIPHLFTGAGDPLKTGLAESLERPGTAITGVEIAPGQCIDGIKILLAIKPNMQHLAIPYWAESDVGELEEDVATIQEFLAPHGIRVTGIPFGRVNEVIPRLSGLTESIDTITYFDYCPSKDAVSGMVKLCNQHNITLFACNLAGVRKGAAAGYGSDIENLGYESFDRANFILSQAKVPANIPIKILSQTYRLGVNKKTMSLQGLIYSDKNAHLLREAVIYNTIDDTDD